MKNSEKRLSRACTGEALASINIEPEGEMKNSEKRLSRARTGEALTSINIEPEGEMKMRGRQQRQGKPQIDRMKIERNFR